VFGDAIASTFCGHRTFGNHHPLSLLRLLHTHLKFLLLGGIFVRVQLQLATGDAEVGYMRLEQLGGALATIIAVDLLHKDAARLGALEQGRRDLLLLLPGDGVPLMLLLLELLLGIHRIVGGGGGATRSRCRARRHDAHVADIGGTGGAVAAGGGVGEGVGQVGELVVQLLRLAGRRLEELLLPAGGRHDHLGLVVAQANRPAVIVAAR